MKPKDKEMLVKSRYAMIRALDISKILPWIRQKEGFTQQEEESLLSDIRRRRQVIRFLDMLEKKKTEVYNIFLEALEAHYPHLYLHLIDGEDIDGPAGEEFNILEKTRGYVIQEVDAGQVIPYMKKKDLFTEEEMHSILSGSSTEMRTEAFLDILETKSPEAYDVFLEAIGETYPHVYLALSGEDPLTDDDDW